MQVCLNGREWLPRQRSREGIAYQQRGNCFTWIEDPPRAQEIMARLLRAHGLIRKVPKTRRDYLSASGSRAITAIMAALQASSDSLIKLAV